MGIRKARRFKCPLGEADDVLLVLELVVLLEKGFKHHDRGRAEAKAPCVEAFEGLKDMVRRIFTVGEAKKRRTR